MSTAPEPTIHVVTFRYSTPGNPAAAIRVPADLDVHRVAAHMQFRAEDWFDPGATLYSKGVAEALVRFYGCEEAEMPVPAPAWPDAAVVDLYWERERRCGDDIAAVEDPALAREGLREFLSTRYDA